ncbi:MAG: MFS transporter, partial [Synergistaceae bacterium]|nr:MFS transporter [Synergistaceae bacterium]
MKPLFFRMVSLLIVIYAAFIGLGLPDSLLGAAWPAMRPDLNASVSGAGVISLLVCAGTVVSSLTSSAVLHRFKTSRVTLVSVLLTALALLGTARAGSFFHLCLLAVPLGLGAGSIDAALNNFVALNYEARHMNWLHCFWGVGATSGPMLLSLLMGKNFGWRWGYAVIGALQFCLVIVLFFSLPLWRTAERGDGAARGKNEDRSVTNGEVLRVPGIKYALLSFLCYCGLELSTGLWAASYLVQQKGLTVSLAAAWVSCYYGSVTAGRFVSGCISIKVSSPTLIRLGCAVSVMGVIMLFLPCPPIGSLAGFVLIGLGCAPFYPAMIHQTPRRFGERRSQAAMGLQMASAYVG